MKPLKMIKIEAPELIPDRETLETPSQVSISILILLSRHCHRHCLGHCLGHFRVHRRGTFVGYIVLHIVGDIATGIVGDIVTGIVGDIVFDIVSDIVGDIVITIFMMTNMKLPKAGISLKLTN